MARRRQRNRPSEGARPPDPADFALTNLMRERLSRDTDLKKLLPVFDKPQTGLTTLADLIEVTHVEERTLRRRIESLTGYRPHDLLMRLFLRDVARAMKATREPLGEIAARFGCSVSVLSRAFKRVVGVTASVYRRNYWAARDAFGEA